MYHRVVPLQLFVRHLSPRRQKLRHVAYKFIKHDVYSTTRQTFIEISPLSMKEEPHDQQLEVDQYSVEEMQDIMNLGKLFVSYVVLAVLKSNCQCRIYYYFESGSVSENIISSHTY
jgi:hypothetical protein